MTIYKTPTKFEFMIIALLLAIIIFTSCSGNRTLHNGRYTYQQLQRRGFTCKPFQGSHYIRVTSDSTKVDITSK